MKPGDRVFMFGMYERVGTITARFENSTDTFRFRPSWGDYDWWVLPDGWDMTTVPMHEDELEVLRSGS